MRAELPDIDPDKDVEITAVDHAVRIKAHHDETKSARRSGAIVPGPATGSSSVKVLRTVSWILLGQGVKRCLT